jgi:DNA (cytosine-5)-methyltransferase 1
MIYGSVCSGIEAATVAWETLGWKASFLSEIETFPREVLAHHYPNTPLHGDFTTIKKDDYEPIELLVGGTPCQSFSVAGLREGLNDPRGNLMLEFGALAKRLHPKWIVWENVPGVLSSNGGRDFGTFLGMLGQLGYGFAYRVLDAQYFGVPQRRRRVFVVGCLGDWRSAAAVLFERHSLQGHSAPSRSAGKEIAKCLTRGSNQRYDFETEDFIPSYGIPGNWINRKPENGGNAVEPMHDVAPCQTKTDQHAVAYAFDSMSSNSMKSSNPDSGCNEVDIAKTIDTSGVNPTCNQGGIAIAQPAAHIFKVRGGCEGGGKGYLGQDEQAFTVSTGQDQHLMTPAMQVLRLTPMECERLQGFPDNYTNIPGASDSRRYKALGNSMAVPVMSWLGERIQMVESMHQEVRKAA